MRVLWTCASSCLLLIALAVCLSPPIASAANLSDQAAAERVLGPQWKQLSRRAGIIFAGTVLSSGSAVPRDPGAAPQLPRGVVELHFRVDRPIAGVEPGQLLVIHEWIGILDRQRPMHPGDRVLLFLYPISRLGLTSPVGGPQGQIRLDSTGQHVIERFAHPIHIPQLERAIRAARGE